MAYRLIDIELHSLALDDDKALATLTSDETGIALICRYKGVPIGFIMQQLAPGATVNWPEVAEWMTVEVAAPVLREKLREELALNGATSRHISVTAVVCTKDRPEMLARCVRSLVEQRKQLGLSHSDLQILVVDNAPTDEATKHIVAAMENVRYVVEPLPGLNFARNRALHETTTDVVAYVDDDVVVDRHWLSGLLNAWADYPRAGGVTGQVLPLELRTDAQIYFEKRGGFRRGVERQVYSSDQYHEFAIYRCNTGQFGTGCNMAFRRQTLLDLGGFDEALDTGRPLPGGGDHDILYRAIRGGYALVYEPTCVVFHQHRRTLKELSRQYWTWGTSVLVFATKCYRHDVLLRSLWRRCILLWFSNSVARTCRGFLGREAVPGRMLFWELLGGVVGLFGGYRRSVRRVARIKRQVQ